jgi:hypothetical protein
MDVRPASRVPRIGMPLLLVFLLVALPAAAQSSLPTLLLDEQPVAQPAVAPVGGGFPSAVATDGTNFLIVSTTVLKLMALGQMAMLVDSSGRPLLDTSVHLPSDGGDYTAIAVWNGRIYLVVMRSYEGRTYAVRIDRSGRLLDPAPIEIHVGGEFVGTADGTVVWDGGQFVVTTIAYPRRAVATRLRESGEVLENDIEIASDPSSLFSAVRNGMTIFVWVDNAGLTHSRSMSSAGVLSPVIGVAAIRRATLLVTDDGFLQLVASDAGIDAQHLGLDGQVDAPVVHLSFNDAAGLKVIRSGASYLLLVRSAADGTYRAAHVNSRGEMLDASREVPAPPSDFALISSNGDHTLVSWGIAGDVAGYAPQITFARPLESTEAVQIHRDFVMQSSPRVSWKGTQTVVDWNENGPRTQSGLQLGDDHDVAAAMASSPAATLHLIGRGGTIYAGYTRNALYALMNGHDPLLVDSHPIDAQYVRAVWTGRDFIVVWAHPPAGTDQVDILGARISADGALIDGPTVIADAKRLSDIGIGASASQVLVVYQTAGTARGVRLDAFGAWPADDITTVADLQFNAGSFSVASDGANFFVSWINRSNREPNDWIGGRLLDARGHALTPLTQYSSGGDTKQVMSAFWTGTDYLMVWSREPGSSDLFASRAAADARLLDYPPVHIGSIDGLAESIARGPGGQVAVAYTRDRRVYTRLIVPARQHSASHR